MVVIAKIQRSISQYCMKVVSDCMSLFVFKVALPLINAYFLSPIKTSGLADVLDVLIDQENRKPKKKRNSSGKPKVKNTEIALNPFNELFMCTKCTKSYRLKHSLTRHMRFECGKEPIFACVHCDKKFKHKYDLNVHLRYKHGESLRKENGVLSLD